MPDTDIHTFHNRNGTYMISSVTEEGVIIETHTSYPGGGIQWIEDRREINDDNTQSIYYIDGQGRRYQRIVPAPATVPDPTELTIGDNSDRINMETFSFVTDIGNVEGVRWTPITQSDDRTEEERLKDEIDRFEPDPKNHKAVFNIYLNEQNDDYFILGMQYSPSFILSNCDSEEYKARLESWVKQNINRENDPVYQRKLKRLKALNPKLNQPPESDVLPKWISHRPPEKKEANAEGMVLGWNGLKKSLELLNYTDIQEGSEVPWMETQWITNPR